MFDVISEVLLVGLSAVVGTFVWNHGSGIFNQKYSVPNLSIWRAIMLDMQRYWKAWIAIALIVIALISVVGWRTWLSDNKTNIETQSQIQSLIKSNQDLIERIDALILRMETNSGTAK